MNTRTPGIQIIRKTEELKPTATEAYLTGLFLSSLVLCPLFIALAILTKLWAKIGTTDTTGIYVGVALGFLVSMVLSFIFMKLATK